MMGLIIPAHVLLILVVIRDGGRRAWEVLVRFACPYRER